jgi:hypothetical protein
MSTGHDDEPELVHVVDEPALSTDVH